jgi:peroxiredoxin
MSMRAKFVVFFLLLTVVLVFAVNPVVGKEKAANFSLVDIDGKSFSLSDYRGKVVLLDFFTTWCNPCVLEIEHLRGLYAEYSADEFVILSISVDPDGDTVSMLQVFAFQNEMTWTVARDTDNVAYKYGVSPIPHLVIVDAEGYETYSHIGLTAESTLRSEINSLVSESGNGDPNAGQNNSSSTLVAVIGVFAIVLLVVGVVVARKMSRQSKRAKKRRSRKRKR